jgi:hypothetical protein
VGVGVTIAVEVIVAVGWPLGVVVTLGVAVLVGWEVMLDVTVGVTVGAFVGVSLDVAVGVLVGGPVGVTVGVSVGRPVGVIVGVSVGVPVDVTVGVSVGKGVIVADDVAVADRVMVGLSVIVGVGVGTLVFLSFGMSAESIPSGELAVAEALGPRQATGTRRTRNTKTTGMNSRARWCCTSILQTHFRACGYIGFPNDVAAKQPGEPYNSAQGTLGQARPQMVLGANKERGVACLRRSQAPTGGESITGRPKPAENDAPLTAPLRAPRQDEGAL